MPSVLGTSNLSGPPVNTGTPTAVYSGRYLPSLTTISGGGVSGFSTGGYSNYMVVGNKVFVTGKFSVTQSASQQFFSFNISVPVACGRLFDGDVHGTVTALDNALLTAVGFVEEVITPFDSNQVRMYYRFAASNSAPTTEVWYSFSYNLTPLA